MVSSVVNYLAPKGHQILILTTGEETKDPVPLFELHRDVKIVQLWISDTKEVRRKLRSIVMDFNPDVLLARAASSVFFFLLEAVQDLTTAVILSESYPPRASAKHFGSDAARLSAFSAAENGCKGCLGDGEWQIVCCLRRRTFLPEGFGRGGQPHFSAGISGHQYARKSRRQAVAGHFWAGNAGS